MKTIDIKGKNYVQVNERLKYFRETFPDFALRSELLSNMNGVCIFKAEILNPESVVVATGHAYEKEGSTFINKTSYIENCETSAWGRALGNLGIGIDESVASSEEVENAIKQQEAEGNPPLKVVQKSKELLMTDDQKIQLSDCLTDAGLEANATNKQKLAKKYGITAKTTAKEADKIINKIIDDFSAGEIL